MKGKRGFTLIEVLIVVIILGILATIAIPQLGQMVRRARLAEAWTNLAAIRTAESIYYMEQNTFGDITDLSDLALPNNGVNFTYAIEAGFGTTYNATATGVAGTSFEGVRAWMSNVGTNGSTY